MVCPVVSVPARFTLHQRLFPHRLLGSYHTLLSSLAEREIESQRSRQWNFMWEEV